MKKIFYFLLTIILLTGCIVKDKEVTFDLKTDRVQVGINQDIDYLSYILSTDNLDEIIYNEIDTSHVGTYTVEYHLDDIVKYLTVDVVKMYEGNIFFSFRDSS